MSDIDNTNELDSYGVWVKQPGKENNVEDLDSTDVFDLPDFPETSLDTENLDDFLNDFEDSPAEETSIEETVEETSPEVSDFEDIMGDFEVEEPAPEAQIELDATNDFDIESFTEDETPVEETEESSSDDFQLPEEDGEISLDEFMDGDFSDESVAAGNNGFSEEELASQKAASTEEVSFEDGELSLDDFLDGGEFTMAPEEVEPKKEEIIEEKPLEMDISFDAEADTVATEDNVELDLNTLTEDESSSEGGEESRSTEVSGDTEEIDLSDFGIDSDADETPINQDVDASKAKDAVVDYDLSVGDEKTTTAPVVNEIKEISKEEAAPAPQAAAVPEGSEVVSSDLLRQIIADLSGLKNEINTLKTNLETMKSAPAVAEEPVIEETPVFDETPAIEEPVIEETPVFDESPVIEEPVIEETPVVEEEEPVIEETAVSDDDLNFEIEAPAHETAGFFGDDDGDDTIALSGNELDNIMSSVEFTEAEPDNVSEEITEEPAEDFAVEETVEIEDEIEVAPVIEEDNTEIPVVSEDISDAFVSKLSDDEIEFTDDVTVEESAEVEETAVEDEGLDIIEDTVEESTGFFGDDDGDDTIALSGNELDNILNTADFTEENAEEEINDEGIDFSPANEEDNFEINDTLEEPDLDDISIIEEDDELPEEISIPKADDILVESSSTDFMDSVKDSSEDNVSDFDDFMTEEQPSEITDDTIDFLSEEIPEDVMGETDEVEAFAEEEPAIEEIIEETAEIEESSVEETPVFEEEPVVEVEENEEPVLEETAVEESALSEDDFGNVDSIFDTEVPAEDSVETPVVEEPVTEEPVETPVIEDSAPIPAAEPAPAAPASENTTLQNDIKSVLLYMDQLLENLPEEKIVEFAKSEEFTTYKKLFSELGLA